MMDEHLIPCPSTGMLLEQHKDAVLKLLSDPSLLEEQVKLALKTLKEYVEYVCSYGLIMKCESFNSSPSLIFINSRSDLTRYQVK